MKTSAQDPRALPLAQRRAQSCRGRLRPQLRSKLLKLLESVLELPERGHQDGLKGIKALRSRARHAHICHMPRARNVLTYYIEFLLSPQNSSFIFLKTAKHILLKFRISTIEFVTDLRQSAHQIAVYT